MEVALVILTRNERKCVEVMFPRIPKPGREAGFDSIHVVDGGSTDGTVEYFAGQGIRPLGQSQRGRGHAFLIAFQQIHADAYVFFSPDGNEDPLDLPKFRPLLESGADIVIASRMMPQSRNEEDDQIFRWRKWVNKAFTLIANLVFRRRGPYITDTINGYRAITRRAVDLLKLDASDYTIEYQMTIRAFKHRLRIDEFPTIEGNRIAGETQASSIATGRRFLRALGREWLDQSTWPGRA
jgi:dolichol-phosphate mannosyltransferase